MKGNEKVRHRVNIPFKEDFMELGSDLLDSNRRNSEFNRKDLSQNFKTVQRSNIKRSLLERDCTPN